MCTPAHGSDSKVLAFSTSIISRRRIVRDEDLEFLIAFGG